MATTKLKESTGLGKEKKTSSPNSITSIPIIPPTKRTPKSSPRSPSTDHKIPSPSSSPLSALSDKHLPNYLKSTASSRHDPNVKQVKKPAPIPETKPCLNRRRSFDRPPSTTARLDKPFRSPGPKERATHVPIRSSSFGAKSTPFVSSTKPGLLDRSASKISKVGKPQQPIQNSKSSTNYAKKSLSLKKEPNKANSALAEIVPSTKNIVEHEDQCSLVPVIEEEEDIKSIEYELDSVLPDPMPELDNEIRTDQQGIKVDILSKDEVEKKLQHDQPTQDREISTIVLNKVTEETPQAAEKEAKSSIKEEENQEPNKGEGEKAEGKEVVVLSEDEEKIEVDHDQEEAQDGETGEKASAAGKQRQGVYNDVIEETASKLLETRKNKVKALAGAFQTVIDYESSSK